MAEYQKPGDRLKEITDQLEKGLQDLFSSGQYADYLNTMSKFYDYSASNSLLIFMQRPDASHVAGYGAWQKNFNRHAKRGEHGIKILAPTPFKQMVEMEKIDPVTQRAMTGADGKPVTEVMEVSYISLLLTPHQLGALFNISSNSFCEIMKTGIFNSNLFFIIIFIVTARTAISSILLKKITFPLLRYVATAV